MLMCHVPCLAGAVFLSLWLGAAGVAVDGRQFPLTALREIRLLKYLRHDNIVNLKEIVTGMPS